MPLSVFVLGLTVFSLGTTEFMVAGLLPELSAGLGVSSAQAGLLISVFALGIVIGSPLVTAATARFERKRALLGLLGLFVVGEFAAGLAPDFGVLMAARVVTAVAHGSFFGLGAVVAAGLVEPRRRARALSIVFGGLTVATIAGVPLGTLIGQQFGWRVTFLVVAVLGIVDLIGVALMVPSQPARRHTHRLRTELAAFRDGRVWLALGTTTLSQAGLYAAYTYVAPLLTQRTGFAAGAVPGLLMLFGAGTLLGSLTGGRLADRALLRTLCGGLAALTLALLAFIPASQGQVPMVIALFVFGFAAFLINPALQTQVMNRTEHAPNLASTANIAAFNLGNAFGPWVAGIGIGGYGLLAPSWIGAVLTAGALGVALSSLALRGRRSERPRELAARV